MPYQSSHNDVTYLTRYADEYFELESDELTLFSLWSHSVFYPVNDNWYVMDDFLNDFTHSGQNIWNPQPHKYVEYVKAMKSVTVADGIITNPSDIDVYALIDGDEVVIPAGETYGSTIEIEIGEKSSESNVRFAEINGKRTEITENAENVYTVMVSDNTLIGIIEKTAENTADAVKTQYFYLDVSTKTATKLSLDYYMETYDEKSIRTREPMGIRFKSHVLTAAKLEEKEFVIDEIGFIVAVTDVLGEDELTLDFSKYIKGVAYNKADNTDIVFESDDNVDVFTGVIKNIPITKYKTNLTCKTYTKITVGGEQFILYGEPVVGNVYDTAQNLLETDPNNADLIKIVLDADYSIGIDVGGLYE